MFLKGHDYRPSRGLVLEKLGERMIKILDLEDGSIRRRHYDPIQYSSPVTDQPVGHDHHQEEEVPQPDEEAHPEGEDPGPEEPALPRRSERLRQQRLNTPQPRD